MHCVNSHACLSCVAILAILAFNPLCDMGKKALSLAQKAQYEEVMKALKDNGVLQTAVRSNKRKQSDTEPAEPLAPKTRVREKKPDKDSEKDSKPDPAPATKGTKRGNPEEPKPKAAKAKAQPPKSTSEKKGAKKAAPKDDDDDDDTKSFFDEEMQVHVSWRNYDEVVKVICEHCPKETPASVKAALTEALGPCPPDVKLPAEAVPAASEEHPGPILEDETLGERDDGNHECEEEEELEEDEEVESQDENEKTTTAGNKKARQDAKDKQVGQEKDVTKVKEGAKEKRTRAESPNREEVAKKKKAPKEKEVAKEKKAPKEKEVAKEKKAPKEKEVAKEKAPDAVVKSITWKDLEDTQVDTQALL